MNEEFANAERHKRSVLITMLGASLVFGIVLTAWSPAGVEQGLPIAPQMLGNLVLMVIGFRWLQIDSATLGIVRPMWLNIGIILLAAVFVPYYLFKTRPQGRRLQPILGFFALVFACAFASSMGAAVMLMLQSGGAPSVAPL